LRDFVIVSELEVELHGGFSVLTGETGAGKSILIDALQLALGARAESNVVREGAVRSDITAEFDSPASLTQWLHDGGFDRAETLLLRRSIDAQGKSRAWVNGSVATIAQLRDVADHLVDIHGQHAWQSLTRSASVRSLLDDYAGIDSRPLASAWSQWRAATESLDRAQGQQAALERERERLAWQIGELGKLAPGADEWAELNAEHTRHANVDTLLQAAREALDAVSDAEHNAQALTGRAIDRLRSAAEIDGELAAVVEVLNGAQSQLQDAAHTLSRFVDHTDTDPSRLAELDERLSAWLTLARRYRRSPAELPALLAQWKTELSTLDASADLDNLRQRVLLALDAYAEVARHVSCARGSAASQLSGAVTQAMQQLGMVGGRFQVALVPQDTPQSFGMESAEFLVAGHAGSTPRPLNKVASGGELSRLALAIAVTTCQLQGHDTAASTLIFDEIDAGVGGAVAETVGRLMKQLGTQRQVLAVTHLPQVAACADHHHLVSKSTESDHTRSDLRLVSGEARVAEIARMLAGERLSGTSLAHAQEMLSIGRTARVSPADSAP
jgi:DNA repair protein RecN (Recombination protein N)